MDRAAPSMTSTVQSGVRATLSGGAATAPYGRAGGYGYPLCPAGPAPGDGAAGHPCDTEKGAAIEDAGGKFRYLRRLTTPEASG